MSRRRQIIALGLVGCAVALLIGVTAYLNTNRVCTLELGINASPRAAVIDMGERLRLKAEVVTCGGAKRSTPDDLAWASDDPSIAVVTGNGVVRGVARGQTLVHASSKRFGDLWSYSITVRSG